MPSVLAQILRLALFVFLFVPGLLFAATKPAVDNDEPPTAKELNQGYKDRTLLVRPRVDRSTAPDALNRAEAGAQVRLRRAFPRFRGLRVVELAADEDPQVVAQRLRATGLYDLVETDVLRTAHVLPDDPSFSRQWHLRNTGQEFGKLGADISAAAAWDVQREAPEIVVAVIDSGARLTHEDLRDNLWRNPGESGDGKETNSRDDDANGWIDDLHGINPHQRGTVLSGRPADDRGHGTHVAGIIGATGNNAVGISGVAWKIKLMHLKFLGANGTGSLSNLLACLDYASSKGVRLFNCSFGGGSRSQIEFEAFKRLTDEGAIFVISAGNSAENLDLDPVYPASYALDNFVVVANSTRTDELSPSSSFGAGSVDLAAPGTSILSLGHNRDDEYTVFSGTSMAAPVVTGAFALLRTRYPADTPRALINRLLNAVDPIPALSTKVTSGGRLNLARALTSTSTRPTHDDFARRIPLVGQEGRARGAIAGATLEPGEPIHAAPASGGSLWWSWTATETGLVTFDTAESLLDTTIAVYTGNSLATLRSVASNDDAESGKTFSRLEFMAVAGTTYQIAAAAKTASTGLINLRFVALPANDAFAGAKLLIGPTVVTSYNTSRTTKEPGEVLLSPGAEGRTLWFRWIAPATGPVQISAVSEDPIIGVFTGSSLAALTTIVIDDDSGPGSDAFARFSATAGMSYYIQVDDYALLPGPGTLTITDAAWQFQSAGSISASPAIGADGTIYYLDELGYLYALNPDGTRKWRFSLVGLGDYSSPTVADDGTIYVGGADSSFYAVTPAGTRKWRFTEAKGEFSASPALAPDGTIYARCDDGFLYALNPDGTLRWKYACEAFFEMSPVVGSDGTIYLGSTTGHLHAVNPNGTAKWLFNCGTLIYSTPSIGADGTIYFGNSLGRFYALTPAGIERWTFDANEAIASSAAVGADGTVYFGSDDKTLYALDGATGRKKWSYLCDDTISTSPTLADDGTIYVAASDGVVHALTASGTLIRKYAGSDFHYSSPMLAGGRLYFGNWDRRFYAFDVAHNLDSRAPWPMHRQNLRNTARPTPALGGFPQFANTAPAAVTVNPGTPVTFTAGASGADAGQLTYQWRLDGRAIPGATAANFTVPNAQAGDAGNYSVLVTGSGGSLLGKATSLRLGSVNTSDARLSGLSVLSLTVSESDKLIVGFSVGGVGTSGTKPLLLRASGPALAGFGVGGTIADPFLTLYSGTTVTATNDNWSANDAAGLTATAARLGAFPFAAASLDSALLSNPASGGYTIHLTPSPRSSTGGGMTLAEIYDATAPETLTPATPRLTSVSTLTTIGPGREILTLGFSIQGTTPRTVLLRAVGPSLRAFGVGGPITDPKLELFSGSARIQTNDNWGAATNATEVSAAFDQVGAFALARDAKDAALLVVLPPGGYTVQATGVAAAAGTALVEVYEVP